MAEQIQTEVKGRKACLLRRVIWWFWVVLLTALLVFSLVFAAPWKIISLFAIFLAAATILPRAFRKWFWLGVGIVIIALVVWVFIPENNKGWRPYTFDKEAAELQAKYAVPDSENAAIIYNQILENWKQKEANEPNLPDDWHALSMKGPWLSKDQPEIAAYLWYHRDTIDRALQATRFEKCSFPIVASVLDLGKNMDRTSTARQCAYLLVAAGNNDLAEGNPNEAVEKFISVLQIGQHMSRQPNIVDMLIGIACEALGFGGINNFIVHGDTNELYLKELEQAVSKIKHDWSFDLTGFIDSDKLMFKNMCGWMWYQVNTKGRTRLSRDPTAIVREQIKNTEAMDDAEIKAAMQKWIKLGYWHKKLFKAYTILYWFYVPLIPEKLSEIVNVSYENNYEMAHPDFNWSKEPQEVPIVSLYQFKLNFRQLAETMAKMNSKTYFTLHDIYLKSQAEQRGVVLIIALRRYKNANGQWPQQLEDLKNYISVDTFIDPINGDYFVYKRTEDNFILYSKGENGIDEGGEQETKFSDDYRKIEKIKDDVKIWPAGKAKKTDQENADANQQ